MADERRKGDRRPRKRKVGIPLNLSPTHDGTVRWLPKHGDPSCVVEWFSQHAVRALAWAPVYTAVVVTVILIVMVLMYLSGVPVWEAKP